MFSGPPVTAGSSAATAGMQGTGKACEQITTDPTLAMNACNNAHDKCLDTSNTAMIRSISGKCATGGIMGAKNENCLKYSGDPSTPAAVACFDDCAKTQLTKALGDTLSDACLACPDAVVTCGAKFCLIDCIQDPLAPGCTACLCQTHDDALGTGKPGNCLMDVFSQCSGYKVTADAVGCTGLTGAAGTMASMGAAGTSSGAAGMTAGMGAAGSGGTFATAGTGAGGTGAGGMSSAGAGGAAGGEPGTKVPQMCLKMPSNVVFIGDSYINYALAHPELNGMIAALAIKDGALQTGQNYTDYAVPGTTLSAGTPQIPGMWTQAKAANKNIQVVVMDGGGNDVLINNMQCKVNGSSMDATCKMVVQASLNTAKMMISDMKASGVTEVIYFFYPHPPTGGWEIDDYAIPMLDAMCAGLSDSKFQCRFINTVPIFANHNDWYASDGIHANATGEQAIADVIWKQMKADCAGQAASSGCCM
jgi:lysophospholipase L1-like esterase